MDDEGPSPARADVNAHPSPDLVASANDDSALPVTAPVVAGDSTTMDPEPDTSPEHKLAPSDHSPEHTAEQLDNLPNPNTNLENGPSSNLAPSSSSGAVLDSVETADPKPVKDSSLAVQEPLSDIPAVIKQEPSVAAVADIPSALETDVSQEPQQDKDTALVEQNAFTFDQEEDADASLDWMNSRDAEQDSADPSSTNPPLDHPAQPPPLSQSTLATDDAFASADPLDPADSFDQLLAQPIEATKDSIPNQVASSETHQSSRANHDTADAIPESAPDTLAWTDDTSDPLPWEADAQPVAQTESDKAGLDDWAENTESSAFGFSEDAGDTSTDWANELGLSKANASQATPDLDIEDSWSKAFGSPESGLDDSWNAVFAEGFDDEDGLLDEQSLQPAQPQPQQLPQQQQQQQQPIPATTNPSFPPTQQSPIHPFSSPYTATPPIAASTPAQQPASTPMQFFAELPSATVRSRKPRQQAIPQQKPSVPPPPPAANQPRQMSPQQVPPNSMQFRAPDRMDPFPPQPSVPVHSPTQSYSSPVPRPPSQTATRYSPAPTSQPPAYAGTQAAQAPPPAPSRYSSYAPKPQETSPAKPTPPPPTRSPYAPAPTASSAPKLPYAKPNESTASIEPLKRPSAPPAPTQGVAPAIGDFRTPSMSSVYSPNQPLQSSSPSETIQHDVSNQMGYAAGPPAPPPANRFAPRTSSPLAHQDHRPNTLQGQTQWNGPTGSSPARSATYSPQHQVPSPQDTRSSVPPPHRPQTSSPGATTRQPPGSGASANRAASVQSQYFSQNSVIDGGRMPHTSPGGQYDNLDFVLPTDETMHDPLQRWKGSPIFHWGPGGVAVTSLPSHIPRYGGGQAAPKMKPVAGELKLQRAKEFFSFQEQLPPFPGPLKSKSKKKEAVNWLTSAIGILEQQAQQASNAPAGEWTKLDEKVVLWKVMKVLIESDGKLAGNPTVDASAREALKSHNETSRSGSNPAEAALDAVPSNPANPAAIDEIKHHLLQGDREKAVWHAADNQLWAHAMLLAIAAGPTIWKQVVQEFVKKEVRRADRDTQSLAALYQVLGGNWDESIDELVPLSARSGFQMISTATTPGQTRDAFDGLNKWRETLTLILNNRSPGDDQGILSLGKLLAGSGRIEAAHVCFLFARDIAPFGGADDPQTVISLLGTDHTRPWANGGVDVDAIRLSEVYEFALSLGPSTSSQFVPHLQAYKLQHALSLAESGQRAEALLYCDVIAAAMKSTTRLSPYYNSTLVAQLDDLQRRLSQSPKDGSSSWISRPSIGKVSSSMGTWFNSFVAGDDNDGASTGSGHQSEAENGPFARISGDTPIISRSASSVDLFGAEIPKAQIPATAAASRYAPAAYASKPLQHEDFGSQGSFTPYSSSPEQRHGTYSPRLGNEGPAQPYGSPPKFSRAPSHLSQYQSYSPHTRPDSASSGARPGTSYEPYVPTVQEEGAYPEGLESTQPEIKPRSSSLAPDAAKSNGYAPNSNGYSPNMGGYQPVVAMNETQNGGGYEPPSGYEPPNDSTAATSSYEPEEPLQTGYAPPQGGYEPPTGGYEPPTGGYEPPSGSYEPPSGGYEPPSGGYEPPTGGYQPYQQDDPAADDDNEGEPKKRSIMDDDNDDVAARAEALKRQEKAARDKAADDAFRAAAEADANRDKAKKDNRSSSGWFGGIGGLFGGKKDPSMPTVHKAKLGEESSFYYDSETKKWVNRKAGSSPAPSTPAAAPPPPRSSAPPSRNVSSPAGPPPTSSPSMPPVGSGAAALKPPPSSYPVRDANTSGPPSRSDTPASAADSTTSDLNPTSEPLAPSASAPVSVPASGPPSAPQSRPPTSMSNASSIDDLIGVPQARKGGTIKKGKKGQRYIDVMAK